MPDRDYGTLHIFGQQVWHDDAYIIGDRRGLELLRDLIDRALRDGVARNEGCDFFQEDGEGFPLNIAVATEDELRGLSSAYHDCELFPDYDGTSQDEIVAAKLRELPHV